jgi:hypothetical protein
MWITGLTSSRQLLRKQTEERLVFQFNKRGGFTKARFWSAEEHILGLSGRGVLILGASL